jgi:putative heme-binding domain-containing protein
MPRFLIAVAFIAATLPLAAQRGGGANAPTALPPGDAANGKALVAVNKCFDCHRIGETGSRVGPDLTAIGAAGRTAERLTAALVAPDDEVLPENRYVRVVTKDGATVTGRLLNQDAFTVQLISDKDELKSYPKSTLRGLAILDKGLMPSYAATLTSQQVADIVNYLASLKGVQQTGLAK